MWYFNGEIITRPKSMIISSVLYPQTIFQDTTTLTSLGIKPYREVKPDSRYYFNGAFTVNTSGDEVVGTYAGTQKNLANLKSKMLEKTKLHVASLHAEIDWYWTRASKGGTAVPSNIQTYATALYSEHETKKTEIASLNTIAKIKAYESKPFTETRKEKVLDDDGNFVEYHASNTFTVAKTIDMCTHYSKNPTHDVDAGLVSLVAD